MFVQISEPADASSLGGGVDLYGSLMGPLPSDRLPVYQALSHIVQFWNQFLLLADTSSLGGGVDLYGSLIGRLPFGACRDQFLGWRCESLRVAYEPVAFRTSSCVRGTTTA